ncbi:MAG: methyltransferase domain-containing protein [Bacteroidia bacterium]|nr:methyltransferase domain-containing protein [Bacteroidia bacterium]
MTSCQCQGIESLFNEKEARKKLKEYRKNGPQKITKILLEAIKQNNTTNKTLLDIGGGIGGMQYDLLKSGVSEVTSVDASIAYHNVAEKETEYQGFSNSIKRYHGDFVELSSEIPHHDIVTMDKVICCYDDIQGLIDHSSKKCNETYGVIYPIDSVIAKWLQNVVNVFFKVFQNGFQVFIHSRSDIENILSSNGFKLTLRKTHWVWQICVYTKI